MASVTKGNCYLCGQELGKTAMKTHLAKAHEEPDGDQPCYLLKIEGAYDKNYWLLADFPMDAPLASVDTFLRDIWLECCGHMSEFFSQGRQIGKSRKLGDYSVGDSFRHKYDFGTTTETVVTIAGESVRKAQKDDARLLARNIPLRYRCRKCKKLATVICVECANEFDNPFYCGACAGKHEHGDALLPTANSPRMGECGYEGEQDIYTFDPSLYQDAQPSS